MDQILKIKLGREVKDYLSITFGLICCALGWAAFLLPYQITTGGVTGISAIIYYVTGIEIQVSYFIINAVFLGFALKILGPKFSLKTIYAIFMLTFLLWLFQALLKNPDGTLPQLLGPGQEFIDESCVVFDSAETLYSSISMFAFLTSEKTIVDNYEKIWKNITNSGKYE